ncbi:hypothetical protein [Burkholderia ubonensis]|uniref:hypothetical protein n=1 Tax=Burkholderia ubonensis TaxID=101571 RepID=UPI000758EC7A|nr:hypothetical protein [Burkholderia ubonensis]KVD37870.1 hypothetical protein WI83_06820 [Burkholderia ubonensis]
MTTFAMRRRRAATVGGNVAPRSRAGALTALIGAPYLLGLLIVEASSYRAAVPIGMISAPALSWSR